MDPNASNQSKKFIHRMPLQCLTQLLVLNEASVRQSEGRLIMPVLVYLEIGASPGEKTNKGHRYTEIHP